MSITDKYQRAVVPIDRSIDRYVYISIQWRHKQKEIKKNLLDQKYILSY
mgnify:CR=1 FL=1